MARGPSVQIEAQLGSRISATLRAELNSLGAESDPELWASGMLHLAERMERRGQSAEALLLLENLRALGAELSGPAAHILARAERRRQALLGGGKVGDRAELLISRFAKESTDPAALASLNRSRTREAPTPTIASTNSDAAIEKKGTFASPATAWASSVLPVPGEPESSTPWGIRPPSRRYLSGLRRKSTTSVSSALASSIPATSANVTRSPVAS